MPTQHTKPYSGKLAEFAEPLKRLVQGGMRIEAAIRTLNLDACAVTARRAIDHAEGFAATEPPFIPDMPARWADLQVRTEMLPFANPRLRTDLRGVGIHTIADLSKPMAALRAKDVASLRPELERVGKRLRWLEGELEAAARQAEEPKNLHDLVARAIVVGMKNDPRGTSVAIVAGALNDRGASRAEMSQFMDCSPGLFSQIKRKAASKIDRMLRRVDGSRWVWAAARARRSNAQERREDPFFHGMTEFGLEALGATYDWQGIEEDADEANAPIGVCRPRRWREEEITNLYTFFGLDRPPPVRLGRSWR